MSYDFINDMRARARPSFARTPNDVPQSSKHFLKNEQVININSIVPSNSQTKIMVNQSSQSKTANPSHLSMNTTTTTTNNNNNNDNTGLSTTQKGNVVKINSPPFSKPFVNARFHGKVKNFNNKKFCFPKNPPKNWSVYCFDDYHRLAIDENILMKFVETMINEAKKFGMLFEKPHKVSTTLVRDIEDLYLFFENIHLDEEGIIPDLIFFGIPNEFTEISSDCVYKFVKHYCDKEFGIISQCFKAHFLTQIPENYFENFMLKVNTKLGGLHRRYDTNFFPKLNRYRTMIIGITNQIFKFGNSKLSLMVVEGSYDCDFSQYRSSVKIYPPEPTKMSLSIDSMIREVLQEYTRQNALFPIHIIIYRDVRNQKQFDDIFALELKTIKDIICQLSSEIKLIFIVVQNPRLRNIPETDERDSLSQIEPIINPQLDKKKGNLFDLGLFFNRIDSVCTKYTIVHNNSNLNYDDVQDFTFICCQNYSRSKSVFDYPTCLRYAGLCAARAKLHADHTFQEKILKSKDTTRYSDELLLINELNNSVQVNTKIRNLLYYC